MTRYLRTKSLHHTIYIAEIQAEPKISRLPTTPDFSWALLAPKSMISIAPAMPSSTPAMRCRDRFSAPTTTESRRTRSGVVVLMIDPSMGEVCTSPNIMHNFLDTPIRSAAAKILRRSALLTFSGFSQMRGISDHAAAITSEADTIASGDM